ncbi:hypothetical protein RQP46_004779 [Phenoliferia psychrophenolica]
MTLSSNGSSSQTDEEIEIIDSGTFNSRRMQSPSPPPPSPITLLDLPTEILLRIGRKLCPLGGRSAANLRLTCSRLARAIAPVVWASINLPKDAKQHAELFAHLIRNKGVRQFITSVSYPLTRDLSFVAIAAAILETLPSLKRLHIEGYHGRLPKALFNEIAELGTLRTLSLAKVNLTGRHLYDIWPATIRSLALDRCTGSFEMFYSVDKKQYSHSPLLSFTFDPLILDDDWCDSETHAVTLALVLHRQACRHLDLEFSWNHADPSDKADVHLQKPVAGQSITLRLVGLFPTPDPTVAVKLLNWIGAANLKELSVPLSLALADHAALRHLVLPSLESLELSSTRTALNFDRLHSSTYPTLVAFLSVASLPRLTRALVSGLLDETSVEKLAGRSIRGLAVSHLHLHGLVDVLLDTNLVELRFTNSDGHLETNVQCLFEREKGEDRWTPRRVTLW